MPGGGHDRVVIIQGNHRKDHVLGQRVARTDEAFRTAGAFQPVQPQHRDAGLGFHRVWIWAAAAGGRPSAAAVRLQNLVKLRRVMP
jgi:hypothetical protein